MGWCSLDIERSALGRHGASAEQSRRKDADLGNEMRQQMSDVS